MQRKATEDINNRPLKRPPIQVHPASQASTLIAGNSSLMLANKPKHMAIADRIYSVVSDGGKFDVYMGRIYAAAPATRIEAQKNTGTLVITIGPITILFSGINKIDNSLYFHYCPVEVPVGVSSGGEESLSHYIHDLLNALPQPLFAFYSLKLYFKLQTRSWAPPNVRDLIERNLRDICGKFNQIYSKNYAATLKLIPEYIERLQKQLEEKKNTILGYLKEVRKSGLFNNSLVNLKDYLEDIRTAFVDDFLEECLCAHVTLVGKKSEENTKWLVNNVLGAFEARFDGMMPINYITMLPSEVVIDDEFMNLFLKNYVRAVETKAKFTVNAIKNLTDQDIYDMSKKLQNENELICVGEEDLWEQAVLDMMSIINSHNLAAL